MYNISALQNVYSPYSSLHFEEQWKQLIKKAERKQQKQKQDTLKKYTI